LQRIRVGLFGAAKDQLRTSELVEVQVSAFPFYYVGEALEQIDQLGVVHGDRCLVQRFATPILDPHRRILPQMQGDLRLLDDDQRALVLMVREFASEVAAPAAEKYETQAEDPIGLYRQLAELGLTGISFPEEYGGGGQSYVTYLLVVEELARAYLALAIGLSVHTLCGFAVDRFGTETQKQEILERLATGQWFGAYSLSEPGSGSDAAALTTRAIPGDGTYVLSGSKVFCTRGAEADVVLVMARTGERGPRGISAFLVENSVPGFSATKKEDKMGWRSSPTWSLTFDDAEISEDRRLGQEGQGFKIALASLDSGRLGIAACSIGLAQAALDHAVTFTAEREQFGAPVSANEGVQFMLADMATQIAAGRSLYRDAARLRDVGEDYSLQAAQSKLFCSDIAMRVTTDAVQLHGGYGYIADYPVERYMREAKGLQIVEGTNQIQRYVIGRKLTS
jgi:alkylation response protein AidB-like acyl-CoA dehydrogenase